MTIKEICSVLTMILLPTIKTKFLQDTFAAAAAAFSGNNRVRRQKLLSHLAFTTTTTTTTTSTTMEKNFMNHRAESLTPPTTPFKPTLGTRTTRLHFSVSAYSGIPSDGRSGTEVLHQLPLRARLPMPSSSSSSSTSTSEKSRLVEIDVFRTDDEIEQGRQLMNYVIEEGKSWPFEEVFETTDGFRGYFMSHAAFCVRPVLTDGDDGIETINKTGDKILGCFYIKPNFPGRCSHICNGGFIVDAAQRGSKVGTLMGSTFLPFAKALGYRSSYFNLVFGSNEASIRLWENLGMKCVAAIPNAARLEGMPPVPNSETDETQLDVAYGYYFDLDTLPDDYNPLRNPNLMDFSV